MKDIEVDIAETVFVFQLPNYYNSVAGSYPQVETSPEPEVKPMLIAQTGVVGTISNEDILLLRAARKAASNDSR